MRAKGIRGVDLFCGVGGLTYGLTQAGVSIVAGVDLDDDCRFPFELNNDGDFYLEDIQSLTAKQVKNWFGDGFITLLAGCAPCQPFSSYSRTKGNDWGLLDSFTRLVRECKPDLVTMENVPGLRKAAVYKRFIAGLKGLGYHIAERCRLDCLQYGIPQKRTRLVVIASRLGPVDFPKPTHSNKCYRTVRQTIGHLPRTRAGGYGKDDRLHVAAGLSETNLRRINSSKPGGTWRDWPSMLVTDCHRKSSGKSFPGIYGRMEWDRPAPTITTQAFGYGSGRFGHPSQARAISLREAAMLQTFPEHYVFIDNDENVNFTRLGRLIGNAVPVRLGQVIGRALVQHVSEHLKSKSKRKLHARGSKVQ